MLYSTSFHLRDTLKSGTYGQVLKATYQCLLTGLSQACIAKTCLRLHFSSQVLTNLRH